LAESRFGIGDVYFLALSMGKCEVIEDDVTWKNRGMYGERDDEKICVNTKKLYE